MAIDYSKRPSGTSEREWKAQQTGGTLNYDTGEITGGNQDVYSPENVKSTLSNPVQSSSMLSGVNFNLADYQNNLAKSMEALNKYDLQTEKAQAWNRNRAGLGLTPMGREESRIASEASIGRTGLANTVTANTAAVQAAKDAYNMALEGEKLKMEQAKQASTLGGTQANTALSTASTALDASKGTDNYVNPYEYIKQRDAYVSSVKGATYSDFDSQFAGRLNPNDYGTVGFTAAQQSGLTGITATQQQKQAEEEKQQQTLVSDLQNKVTNIESLEKSEYLNNAVGPSAFKVFSRFGTPFSAGKQEFIAGVENLTSQDTLNTLINLKAQGGTLGALSDQERIMLQNAASKLNSWAVKDKNGNTVGYNISEKAFKSELERLKNLANKAITKSGGNNDPLGLGI